MNQLLKLILFVGLLGLWSNESQADLLYVANHATGSIAVYDADTGMLINPSFITGLIRPRGLAIDNGALYISDFGTGKVGKYDARTGAVINPALVSGVIFPDAVAVSDNVLYVANMDGREANLGKVRTFDATTGAVLNSLLISDLNFPVGLAVDGNKLFVLLYGDGRGSIGEYDAGTGIVLNSTFIPRVIEANGMVLSGRSLWVDWGTRAPDGAVYKYTVDPEHLAENPGTPPVIPALDRPTSIAVSGDNLYVAFFRDGTVRKYNARTGELLNDKLITTPPGAIGGMIVLTGDSPAMLPDAKGDPMMSTANQLVATVVSSMDYLILGTVLLLVLAVMGLFVIYRDRNPEEPVPEEPRRFHFPTPFYLGLLTLLLMIIALGGYFTFAKVIFTLDANIEGLKNPDGKPVVGSSPHGA